MFWKHASSPHKGWTPRMLNFSLRLALACSRYQLITFIAKNITKEIRSKSSICKNCGSKRKTLPLLKKKKKKKTTTLMIINFRILVSLCNTLKKKKKYLSKFAYRFFLEMIKFSYKIDCNIKL